MGTWGVACRGDQVQPSLSALLHGVLLWKVTVFFKPVINVMSVSEL